MIPKLQNAKFAATFLVTLALLIGGTPLYARDAFVVIAGGGTPLDNNYSQYLQARAYVTHIKEAYPRAPLWTFFGAGNVAGQRPVIADVHRVVKDEKGREASTWLPGALPGNRPARRNVIARAFREEILPTVRDGGTLYLFVGDHGSPSGRSASPGDAGESVITLWSWDRDPSIRFGWRAYGSAESLGVAELRGWLQAGLGKGRVVFTMSQCYSGGFHFLGIPREAAPNPQWFTEVPKWASAIEVGGSLPQAAGFSATDDETVASGCTADVDSNRWAGYERYLPENLLGLDLFTLTRTAQARRSIFDAHVASILVDQTLDKPRSTSEAYLERWAQLIEKHLLNESQLTPRVKEQIELYKKVIDGAEPQAREPLLLEQQELFKRYRDRLFELDPAFKELATLSQEKLAEAANSRLDQPDLTPQAEKDFKPLIPTDLAYKLWIERLIPAWRKALDAGTVPGISEAIRAYETTIVEADQPKSFMGFQRKVSELAVYWHGGYGDPASQDADEAKRLANWPKERRQRVIEWAKQQDDELVKLSARIAELSFPPSMLDPDYALAKSEPRLAPDRKTAAERILFYRRVLAAWQFLLGTNERSALSKHRALLELERTPMPAPFDRKENVARRPAS